MRHAGRFAAGAGGRRNRHQRLQRPGHRQALADRRVHVVEKIRGRIRRVEVHGLGGVDGRAAADGDERVERPRARERDRVEERFVARLDAHAVVRARRARRSARATRATVAHRRQLPHDRIGHDQHERRAHLGEVHADFARHADAEADAGDGHLERDVFAHWRDSSVARGRDRSGARLERLGPQPARAARSSDGHVHERRAAGKVHRGAAKIDAIPAVGSAGRGGWPEADSRAADRSQRSGVCEAAVARDACAAINEQFRRDTPHR